MCRRLDLVWTDVSEERIASIFRVAKSASEELAWVGGCRPANAGSSLADFLSWRWRRYVPPKRRFTQDLHGNTSRKTTFFIATEVKTSNLTKSIYFTNHGTSLFVYATLRKKNLVEIYVRISYWLMNVVSTQWDVVTFCWWSNCLRYRLTTRQLPSHSRRNLRREKEADTERN
jgi:hypothetical protein